MKAIFLKILESEIMAHFIRKIETEGQWERVINDLMVHRLDRYSLVQKFVAGELIDHH